MNCVTHHHACDCREAMFGELKAQFNAAIKAVRDAEATADTLCAGDPEVLTLAERIEHIRRTLQGVQWACRELRDNLAATQAREVKLREALRECDRQGGAFDWVADARAKGDDVCELDYIADLARTALAIPTDNAYLLWREAEVWEEAAEVVCEHCREGWKASPVGFGLWGHTPDEKRGWNMPCKAAEFHARAQELRQQASASESAREQQEIDGPATTKGETP